jgi:hypothetical protein
VIPKGEAVQAALAEGGAMFRACVLCGEPLGESYGNNPAPLADVGRACADCNRQRVIPERLRRISATPPARATAVRPTRPRVRENVLTASPLFAP